MNFWPTISSRRLTPFSRHTEDIHGLHWVWVWVRHRYRSAYWDRRFADYSSTRTRTTYEQGAELDSRILRNYFQTVWKYGVLAGFARPQGSYVSRAGAGSPNPFKVRPWTHRLKITCLTWNASWWYHHLGWFSIPDWHGKSIMIHDTIVHEWCRYE